MSRRHLGQQLSLVMAVVCGIAALATVGVAAWLIQTRGAGDVIAASAMATAVFLGSCAVVLYVMSRPRPPLPPAGGPQPD